MSLTFLLLLLIGVLLLSGTALGLAEPGPGATAPAFETARVEPYRHTDETTLAMHIALPTGHQPRDRRPAIVFFFGGGWTHGTPAQFGPQARHLAARGMVALCAEYRVAQRHGTTPFDAVADGKAALRWTRQQADRLGIDPQRIAAAGGSAGGHLAACTALVPGFEPEADVTSSRPDAMVLFNPVVDTGPAGYGHERLGDRAAEISPVAHVQPGAPPTVLFHGETDETVPFENAERFAHAMQTAGNHCELIGFPKHGHGFFNQGEAYQQTLDRTDAFLVSLGWLRGVPAS